MPTKRALAFLIVSVLLYLFANQTQVGWIYIMSAIVAGVLAASWWLNRRTLRGITASRVFSAQKQNTDIAKKNQRSSGNSASSAFNGLDQDLHEGDEINIQLTLRNTNRSTASLVRAAESCPFAAPSAETLRATSLQLFVPSLLQNQTAQFNYTVIADRRGVHRFPPLKISTRAPFGLFERKRDLDQPTPILIYPEVKKLRRLSLLDRQPAAQIVTQRAGIGTEIIGVRAYRVGDSPRHIHWRSVARTNHLVSKEFADETHPGLTLVLDVFNQKSEINIQKSKHTPFEYAVKIAASIGDYALRRAYPLHLLVDESSLAAPSGALNRIALLEYLARVQAEGKRSLADVIHTRATQTFVAVIMPYPDSTALETLSALSRRAEVMVVLLDPESFPGGGITARSFADQLRALEIDVRLIRYNEDWTHSLQDKKQNAEYAAVR
mgnify:CR=1 FL=1